MRRLSLLEHQTASIERRGSVVTDDAPEFVLVVDGFQNIDGRDNPASARKSRFLSVRLSSHSFGFEFSLPFYIPPCV